MDMIGVFSGAIGIGPSILLLWFVLRDYTWPRMEKPLFDDRKLFLSLAVGIVAGTILVLFRIISVSLYILGIDMFILVYVIGLATIGELLKLIILNYPKLQKNLDTTFYGVALGLGAATTISFLTAYINLTDAAAGSGIDASILLSLILLSINTSFIHLSTGAMIGYGSYSQQALRYAFYAIICMVLYNLCFIPSMVFETSIWISLIGMTPLSFFIYYWANKNIVKGTLPGVIKKEIRQKEKKGRRA